MLDKNGKEQFYIDVIIDKKSSLAYTTAGNALVNQTQITWIDRRDDESIEILRYGACYSKGAMCKKKRPP